MIMENSLSPHSSSQQIFCWGRAASGELGLGLAPQEQRKSNVSIPTVLTAFREEVAEISCGKHHVVFLLKNGLVYSCGSNDFSQLGHSKNGSKPELIQMLENMSIKQVACGESFTLVLNSQNELRMFGDNRRGQAGHDDVKTISKPKQIKKFTPPLNNTSIVQVACGASHCLALTSSGQVYSWGDNGNGQLGNYKKGGSISTATRIKALSHLPIYMVAAGGSHCFALTISGTLFAWGKNSFGQLGIGDKQDRCLPVRVDSLRSKFVRHVCCGEEHTAVLTKQGQVFTFGYGAKGQLGHGVKDNEINPKQVVELMGSVVTQISCARWHTLAYIEKTSRGTSRLYSFGQNQFGQLGEGSLTDQLLPTVVQPAWYNQNEKMRSFQPLSDTTNSVENNDMEAVEGDVNHMDVDDDDVDVLKIENIFSGGSQNFVILKRNKIHHAAHDMRETVIDSRTTMFLTEAKVKQLVEDCGPGSKEETSKKALEEVAMVVSSASCLNGSFLNPDTHESTGLDFHGLSLSTTRRMFVALLAVDDIKRKIKVSLSDHLLPSLSSSPSDIEALRIYLILPEIVIYEGTKDAYQDMWFIISLGEQILKLRDEAKRVLFHWWAKHPGSFLLQIIKNLYHQSSWLTDASHCTHCMMQIIQHYVDNEDNPDNAFKLCCEYGMKDFPNLGSECVTSLHVLKLVNEVNNAAGGIVPFDKFYIPCIQQKINIQHDYQIFIRSQGTQFCFTQFMFVFDVKAKARILETDAHLKMMHEMEKTCIRNMSHQQFNPSNPYLVVHIRRGDNLVRDTLHEIQKHMEQTSEFKKPLKVVFQGEEAIDAGGPKKEFFLLLIKEIFDRKYGMFKEIESSRTVWFDPQTFEDPNMYFMIGLICGLALYNSIIIDVHFPPVLYKKLLNQKTTLDDFRGFDPDYARNLQYLLDFVDDEHGNIKEIFDQNFQVEEIVYGNRMFVDLKPNGANINLTSENREEYVDLSIDYKLNVSVKNQFEKFKDGFYTVSDKDLLSFWHSQELMEMIAGREEYDDFMKLKDNAEYKNGYHRDHVIIRFFWEVLRDFDLDLKKKFLVFLTGSDKIPVEGIDSVKVTIQPLVRSSQETQDLLPEASTCFNILSLPRYNSKVIMEPKLKLALHEFSKGFGME